MAYRINPRRKASRQVRKAALDRISAALQALALPAERRAEGVHQARKRFKELRALLRLVREPLGKSFTRFNLAVRDLGRALAESRDAAAMLESWDALAKEHHATFATESFRQVRHRLEGRAKASAGQADDWAAHLAEVQAQLQALAGEIERWSLEGKGFALLQPGLARTYRDGRRDLALARREPSDERLHEWRKRVKDQWYHSQLLTPLWPDAFDFRSGQLKRLSDALGDDHDLAMMLALLQADPELFGSAATRERLLRLIDKRRAALQAEAFTLGARLYAEKPGALTQRWQRYWRIARAG
ncbi:CHAD domain-containing protein [Stutzerimonas balearica]|uniref:CHAD domain-containing protein n=1 Tax=Stutzerimonas balearica DSM 6083 TaxID=1123016 RepID=A0A8D4C7Q7_9GAMM|nr:CHAD domain-containing protein [Stutzerimonas balearica]AJE16172.1 hypothetical protein CL52_14445 [Stutzerimonas balearica DSM 6083]SDM12398.1 CHAD domain-containing protein [Stutzerimonas balearica DSM 6083]HAV87522.1 CHAD domain-containing protein [Pseudomonas sp.]